MSTSPRGWSTRFPVYQIDFGTSAAGKRVATTKRKIRWRFGFPNQKALDEGQTGTDCRGEEHDVTLVWSVTSGKRVLTMDGREVHYSTSRSSMLDFSWATRGNHVVKVLCHATPPLSPPRGFRQYELLIDGQSFFNMPRVFELGIKGHSSQSRVPGYTQGYSNPTSPISMGSGSQGRNVDRNDYSAPATREQEEEDLKKAIQASIEESRRHLEAKQPDERSAYTSPYAGASSSGDLLDLGGPSPAPAVVPSDARSVASMPNYYSAPPTYSQNPPAYGSPPPYQSPPPIQTANPVASPQPAVAPGALVPSHGPPGYYGAPPPTTPSYASPAPAPAYASPPAAPPPYASPAPVPPVPAPTPEHVSYGRSHADMLSTPTNAGGDIFGLNSPPQDDPFAPKPPPPPTQQDLANVILGAYAAPPAAAAASPHTPGAPPPQANGSTPQGAPPQQNGQSPMTMNALVPTEDDEPQNEFDKALKKLVNVDRIDEPAEAEIKLTMMKQEEANKAPKGKSKPLPPVGHNIVGGSATLDQIKSVKPEKNTMTNDGVMKAPPPGLFQQGVAGSGALVVHGQGPPPLHQPMGFGVGASLPNGGMQQHQQQQPQMGYQQAPHYR